MTQGSLSVAPLKAILSRFVLSFVPKSLAHKSLATPKCLFLSSSLVHSFQDIISTAFENGINMIDTAENYAGGESEKQMYVVSSRFGQLSTRLIIQLLHSCSGRALKELGYRRSDLVVTTKLFWGTRSGPNDMGLSRKQCVCPDCWSVSLETDLHASKASLRVLRSRLNVFSSTMWTSSLRIARIPPVSLLWWSGAPHITDRVSSADGGGRPRVQLGHRKGMGTCDL